MIVFLLKISLCWSFFALLYALVLRQETFFGANRIYLLATMLLSIGLAALPGEQIPVPVQKNGEPFLIVPAISNGLQQVSVPPVSAPGFDYLWLVYGAGAGLAGARLILGLYRILSLIRRGRVERQSDGTCLVYTDRVATPFSFFRWIFIAGPAHRDPEGSQPFNSMLAHEKAHARKRHSLDILIAEFICVVLWFHPLAYWYKSALRAVHEYQADAFASRQSDLKQYGLLLIGQSQCAMPVAFANHFFQSPLKQRLIMLTKKTSSPLRAFKFSLALPLAVFLAFFFRQAPLLAQQNGAAPASKSVDAEPDFPGGNAALMQFLTENIHYPESAKAANAEGLVVFSFTVKKDGSLADIRELKTKNVNHPDMVTEARRVIDLMPKWKPAIVDGKITETQYSLPIRFKLDQDEVVKYQDTDKKPSFPGGEEAMMRFISSKINYPQAARKAGIGGMVAIRFIVEKDGSIGNITALKSPDPSLSEEAIRVVKLMPKFDPGFKAGAAVRVEFVLPVKFKLS